MPIPTRTCIASRQHDEFFFRFTVMKFHYVVLAVLFPCLLNNCISSSVALIQHPSVTWVQDSSKHFRYFMEKEIWTQHRLDSIKVRSEAELFHILQLLNEKQFPHKIDYFITSDCSKHFLLSKLKPSVVNDYDTLGVFSYSPPWMIEKFAYQLYSPLKYHLAIFAINSLYRRSPIWLDIGFTVFVNNHYANYDLHTLAAYIHRQYKTTIFSFFPTPSTLIKYDAPLYGSFVKFVHEKYGSRYIYSLSQEEWTQPTLNDLLIEWRLMLQNDFPQSSQQDTIKY